MLTNNIISFATSPGEKGGKNENDDDASRTSVPINLKIIPLSAQYLQKTQ